MKYSITAAWAARPIMRTSIRLIPTVALALGCQSTHARGDGDLWVMAVGPMCLAQYPSQADSALGRLFLRGSDIDTYLTRPLARCFRKHNWASVRLCEELMGLGNEQMHDLQVVYEHHRDEIRGMTVAFDYFNGYIARDPSSASWPQPCPADSE